MTTTTALRLIVNSPAEQIKFAITGGDSDERATLKARGYRWLPPQRAWLGGAQPDAATIIRDRAIAERGYRLNYNEPSVLRLVSHDRPIPIAVTDDGHVWRHEDMVRPIGHFRFDGVQDGYVLYTLTLA